LKFIWNYQDQGVSEKKGGAMHKDKGYKDKEEEEEELDELESSALLLFGCD